MKNRQAFADLMQIQAHSEQKGVNAISLQQALTAAIKCAVEGDMTLRQ